MTTRFGTALLCLASYTAPASAQVRTVTLDVPGMTCPTCPIALRKVLLKQAGVSAVVVHYQRKQLEVVYEDSQVSAAALMRTTASVGFPAQVHSERIE